MAHLLGTEAEHLMHVNSELLKALKEITCWIAQGMTAAEAGAKCETLTEALDQCDNAIALAEPRTDKPAKEQA